MRPLSRLAQSLDQVVSLAASRHEWKMRLAEEWPAAERFLKPRGTIVPTMACPSPGGDGCPRQVVRLGPDAFRAVCANSPRECDSLDLTLGDVEVLAVDTRGLAAEIATALEVEPEYRERRGVIHLGRHLIAAGNGFPVAMVLGSAGWGPGLHLPDFGDDAGAILVSSPSSLDQDLQTQLRLRGHRIYGLHDVVQQANGALMSVARPADLFRELRTRLSPQSQRRLGPPWSLPAGTKWEDLKFDLWSFEHLTVASRGESNRLEPEHLGLRSRKTSKPTIGWIILVMLFVSGGTIDRKLLKPAPERQLHLLNMTLRESLGLRDNPIVLDRQDRAYIPRFRAESHVPKRQLEISGTTLDRLRDYFRKLPQEVS